MALLSTTSLGATAKTNKERNSSGAAMDLTVKRIKTLGSDGEEKSALHRLAEAAERKQIEDELLELQGRGPNRKNGGDKFILRHPDSSSDSLLLYSLSTADGDGSQCSSRTNSPKMMDDPSGHLTSGSSLGSGGVSRQQLINSPCPVCGDKISGFHYGIFSCESCKGFFKRTVQNKKNYVCLRGSTCPVTISTRKKCPACRFEKCLSIGMKLEAIREDRTRGGRSTYQCSSTPSSYSLSTTGSTNTSTIPTIIKREPPEVTVPILLKEIMSVEHLWFWNDGSSNESPHSSGSAPQTLALLVDKSLNKLVRWCKSLPLFKNIQVDDQITLLINAWCELLVFSCCYKSVDSGVIRLSNEKSLSLESAQSLGIQEFIEKMLKFSDQLRRLKVDHYEYVSLKVILLLTSVDTAGLKELHHVRESQEQVVQALQAYTSHHYPSMPSKFGELLLRIPELQQVCQVSRDMLQPSHSGDETSPGCNLLMELLRGDH